jgi:DNA-binding transcriptional LysR family regulator
LQVHITFERLVSRLKLRHFLLLQVLSQTATLQQAAARLKISQPVASTRLREIESAVGVKLFNRHPHGVSPNETGEAMIRWSNVILRDLENARNDLEAFAASSAGRLRLGVSPTTEHGAVPNGLMELRKRYPSVILSVTAGHDASLLKGLQGGELDLVVTRLVPSVVRGGFHHEILYTDSTDVVVGIHHPLTRVEPFRFSEMDKFEWILPSTLSSSFDMIAKKLVTNGALAPRVAFETASVILTASLLKDSEFIAIMPSKLALTYRQQKLLAKLPISLPDGDYPMVALVRGGDATRSPACTDFINILKKSAGLH